MSPRVVISLEQKVNARLKLVILEQALTEKLLSFRGLGREVSLEPNVLFFPCNNTKNWERGGVVSKFAALRLAASGVSEEPIGHQEDNVSTA